MAAIAFGLVAALSACGGTPRRPNGPPPPPSDLEQNIRFMLSYDANSDGRVTRQELDAQIHGATAPLAEKERALEQSLSEKVAVEGELRRGVQGGPPP